MSLEAYLILAIVTATSCILCYIGCQKIAKEAEGQTIADDVL
jgi:hypothetical protein